MRRAVWMLAILVSPSLCAAVDDRPEETLASLKKDLVAASEELESRRKPGTNEAEQKKALDRFYETAADLGRRAMVIVKRRPDAPDAVEALIWARKVGAEGNAEFAGVVYDFVAENYLDSEAIPPFFRLAWVDAVKSPQVETCLRAAVERSKNAKVRALCCFSLGRCYQELASTARDLNDPVRRVIREGILDRFGMVVIRRLRSLNPEKLTREAEACFDRTIKEFGDQRPLGSFFPPLGEQAEGMLFLLHHLGIGCTAPEIEGEDIDGKPMKLSDYRGKVVMVSFWATWCIPCMEQVPHEKALVERMKGRPFVLIGVNGDNDREQAKTFSVREGVNWRSFWPGGSKQGIPLEWGISLWPTFYVIDANGVIRDDGLVYFDEIYGRKTPDKMIEGLVAEVEKAAKR
ncbi:TlpA family protein disulfide reductase [Singulisphaera sp. PoT]|uniref:TlpA family protein disulfide reductase n=1 Tax=Singulisphaera sp. PoT TaxID=3411797 RepID=UPI003BF5B9F3